MRIPFSANSTEADGGAAGRRVPRLPRRRLRPAALRHALGKPELHLPQHHLRSGDRQLNKGQTAVDHLVVRAQPSWYLSGSSFAGRQYISYGPDGAKIEAQTSPQIVFRSLFGGFVPDRQRRDRAPRVPPARAAERLGLITEKRQSLVGKVGAADRDPARAALRRDPRPREARARRSRR